MSPPDPKDVLECDREPIHIVGSIQPHGHLIAIDAASRRIEHLSRGANPPAWSLGDPIDQVLPQVAAVLPPLELLEAGHAARYLGSVGLDLPAGARQFEAAAHRSGELIIVELEVGVGDATRGLDELYPDLRRFIETIQATSEVDQLCRVTTEEIRRITGFDRVLIYRFDPDWNGTVIGESRNEALPSYLDLRFPASDIPAQARELYRRNRLRIIPDAGYVPVPIEPGLTRAGQPIDLSHSILRSVSPVHVQYMRNMGTAASMSVSILREGRLWGLVACHDHAPRLVPLPTRNACDFITQIFALKLQASEQASSLAYRMRLASVQTRLLGHMAEEERFIEGLVQHPAELMQIAHAEGVAIVTDEQVWRVGRTPPLGPIRALAGWLHEHHPDDVFSTDELMAAWPPAAQLQNSASGLLAIAISKMHAGYILWFRPELVRTVKWGGDPNKANAVQDGRLHPRASFETWKQTVRHRSLPWDPNEVEAVLELRNAVVGVVLRRAEELAMLSEELQRSNRELEAFSYSVSHDLRAPFRHVVGFGELLRSQEGERLSERGRRYVDTMIEAGLSAGSLVDGLLSFSRMGRSALSPRPVELDILVREIADRLSAEAPDRVIHWELRPLARVEVDPVMFRQVIENLLSNAVKYTRKREQAQIRIEGRIEAGDYVIDVADNGSGFDMTYVGKLFGVFQRLHHADEFEGTGIGLANVRRIVERHGGRAWATGAVDAGAQFYVTLPVERVVAAADQRGEHG